VGNGPLSGEMSKITVPPAATSAQDQRLPIFDSLESDWFRRSGKRLGANALAGQQAAPEKQAWSSPADSGWQRAAEAVAAPSAGETTQAGLPKRVPRANLIPGSVGGQEESPPELSRSAEATRSRLASFQRGVREARAAGPRNEEP
jgi:hypothetical protein